MPLTNSTILLDREGNFISGTSGIPVQGQVVTGSTFVGYPLPVGGIDSSNLVRAMKVDSAGSAYVSGSVSISEPVRLLSGSVTRPLSVEPTGGRVNILSASTLTPSNNGSSVLTWQGWSEWYLVILASGSVGGTNPRLQLTVSELDPIDKVTVVGRITTSSYLSASGQYTILEVADTQVDTFKISWVVTGTNSPFFSGVNVSWMGHAAGNSIEGQSDVGEVIQGAPVPVGGVDTNNRIRYFRVDSDGAIVVATQGANATKGYRFGDIALSAITSSVPVFHTPYTEQATDVQRSVVSTSTSDKAGGTGAARVIITYYNISGSGPFTEEVTLNGTVAVNTTASFSYVESMAVSYVGSVGSNVGTISLKSLTGGSGGNIVTIGANENQTFLVHHHVPLGKTCYITDMSCGINGGAGAFSLRSKPINSSGSVELRITEEFRMSAQASTSPRNFGTPLQVTGPARIRMYVTTEAGTSLVYRGAFDFYDQ